MSTIQEVNHGFSSMSGWDFERYCADCLLKKGFTKAEVTSGSGDHGVDIIAEQNGIRFGIQCKVLSGADSHKAVRRRIQGHPTMTATLLLL